MYSFKILVGVRLDVSRRPGRDLAGVVEEIGSAINSDVF